MSDCFQQCLYYKPYIDLQINCSINTGSGQDWILALWELYWTLLNGPRVFFPATLSPSVCLSPSLSLSLQVFFLRKTKNRSSHSDREQKEDMARACHLWSVLIGRDPLCALCCRVDSEAGSSVSVAVDAELSQQSCQGGFTLQAQSWFFFHSCDTFWVG